VTPRRKKKVIVRKQAPAKKQSAATKRPRATEREIKALLDRAAKVRDLDLSIVKGDRTLMSDALKAGAHILWGKEELKRINAKMGFKQWIETECKIPYKRAYNYMRVAEAASKEPSIKELGLTAAYVLLGLVTRKKISADQPTATGSARANKADDKNEDVSAADAETKGADEAPNTTDNGIAKPRESVTRRVGKFDVVREGNFYVLDIPEDWEEVLLNVLSDLPNFNAVVKDGGLLIRMKDVPAQPASAEGEPNV